ncbi:MFS general substrate transporter [Mollisia scopiformis]|uniref:MFS general substrate transporter n=1 Tax=Mollisia scopiformis TaxID=149040 RepID=A0A194XEA1_MOLSC|nr:MFS general substrate transporter [Mollisia scopiformis]KUJ18471.1 MFS general substrate transporter [Mollisia scopiformis]
MDSTKMPEPEGDVKKQALDSDIEASLEKPLEKTSTQNAMEFPEGGLRAWSVAIGAGGVLFSTFGYANALTYKLIETSVYQEYYATHQLSHESPSAISWIGSLQIFFLFGGNCFGGPLFDRFGAKVIWPSAMAYVLSVMMTSLCKKYYQFMLAQGVLGGISMGLTMAPAMAATGQYFNKKRGAAIGIAVAGSSLGGVIFPIALSKLVHNQSIGFGWSIRILGFMMFALLGPACIAIRARLPPRTASFFLPSAFKEITYISLLVASFLMIMGVFMPFFYLPSFAVSKGMSTQLASYIVSILNGASFFGRVIPGVLGDKLGRLNALAAAAFASGILILCMQAISSNAGIIVFSALYGFCSGAIVSGFSTCLAQIPKDPRNIGTYMGMGMAVISVAALISPPIDGAIAKQYGGYNQVAIFSGVLVLAGAVATLWVKSTTERGILGKV